MNVTRRDAVGLITIGAAASLLEAKAAPAQGASGFAPLTERLAEAMLAHSPENATILGLDKGKRQRLKGLLDDRSASGIAAHAATYRGFQRQLAGIDRSALSQPDRITHASIDYVLDLAARGAGFPFGSNSIWDALSQCATPYVVTQMIGAFSSVPELLDAQHEIAARDDTDAYLSRLKALAVAFDRETERIRAAMGSNVVAPDFMLSNAIAQRRSFMKESPARMRLVTSFAARAAAKGLKGDFHTPAARILEQEVLPALQRQTQTLEAAQRKATEVPGVWKLPRGDAYYAWLLRVATTTDLTPEQIHAVGLEQSRQISDRMDQVLRSVGLTQGSVGERMLELSNDQRFIYPNTAAGRTQMIADTNDLVAQLRKLQPKLSRLTMRAEVAVKRVPEDIQDGAGSAYMYQGALDGSRPAIFYINQQDTALWPRWALPSLVAHEAVPGHVWQYAYPIEHPDRMRLITPLLSLNGFVEGWGLYAEQLMDEVGLYDDDPHGLLGYLQALQERAARLVVDTGLHAKQWTRDRAKQWLVDIAGFPQDNALRQVDRYCSTPGQACGYKIGHNEILRLRARAQAQLGNRFDLRDFNDAIVSSGGVPMPVLQLVVDEYIKAASGGAAQT